MIRIFGVKSWWLDVFHGIILLIALVFKVLLSLKPEWCESFYFEKIFLTFRKFWQPISTFSPIPLIFIWSAIFVIVIFLFGFQKFYKKGSWLNFFKSLVLFILAQISLFYLLWGFNYNRLGIAERLGLNGQILPQDLKGELTHTLDNLNRLKAELANDKWLKSTTDQEQVRTLVTRFLEMNNLSNSEFVRCRELKPEGILLIWSTAGIYWPMAGECQIDAGLHSLVKPFVMAHELCHGMGWTNEGECNFIAYEACSISKDPLIRYSGEISYWRYLVSNLQEEDSSFYNSLKIQLNPSILDDLRSIRQKHLAYPDILPVVRDRLYNLFLKVNNVNEGIQSYDLMIGMVRSYRMKKKQ